MSHHALIKSLVDEIRNLRTQVNTLSEPTEQSEYYDNGYAEQARAERQARELRYAREQADQARRDAEDREYETQKLVKELERARSWGDEWGEARTLQKLKRL